MKEGGVVLRGACTMPARRSRERRVGALRVRVVAAAHEEVAPDWRRRMRGELVGERRHADLALEVLARLQSRARRCAARSAGRRSRCRRRASSGTSAPRPPRARRCRAAGPGGARSVPLTMRSVQASAGGRPDEHATRGHGTKSSSSSVYHASSKIRGWSATWNTGVMPCSTNAAQMRSCAGCDSGRPSTSAGAIIAKRHAGAARARRAARSIQSGSRSVRCATGCSRPPPSARTVAHQRFQAAMLAVQRGQRSRAAVRSQRRP